MAARSDRAGSIFSTLDLPPPYRTVRLREAGDAYAYAISIAAQDGAGTFVHVGHCDFAEFAVVLEPSEPLRTARRALYAGLCALGDALAAHAPPEKPIGFEWPDRVLVDGGMVGGVRLGWPANLREDDMPPWLVFAGTVRIIADRSAEPGLSPALTALEEEGFHGLGPRGLIESFARHLMVAFDRYQEGFGALTRLYTARLATDEDMRLQIDDNGDLLLRRVGVCGIERYALAEALRHPSWVDPETGEPRLNEVLRETRP